MRNVNDEMRNGLRGVTLPLVHASWFLPQGISHLFIYISHFSLLITHLRKASLLI